MNRRAFLGWAATGAAGLLVPVLAKPTPKVFVFGSGLHKPTATMIVMTWDTTIFYGYHLSERHVIFLDKPNLSNAEFIEEMRRLHETS